MRSKLSRNLGVHLLSKSSSWSSRPMMLCGKIVGFCLVDNVFQSNVQIRYYREVQGPDGWKFVVRIQSSRSRLICNRTEGHTKVRSVSGKATVFQQTFTQSYERIWSHYPQNTFHCVFTIAYSIAEKNKTIRIPLAFYWLPPCVSDVLNHCSPLISLQLPVLGKVLACRFQKSCKLDGAVQIKGRKWKHRLSATRSAHVQHNEDPKSHFCASNRALVLHRHLLHRNDQD